MHDLRQESISQLCCGFGTQRWFSGWTNCGPEIREKKFSDGWPSWSAQGRRAKGGRIKTQREEVTRRTGLVTPCFPKLYSPKGPRAHCRSLKQDPGIVQRTKYDSMIPISMTKPNLLPHYDILKLSSINSIDTLLPPWIQLLENQPMLS